VRTKPVAIYGGGGFAREVAWLVESCGDADGLLTPVCFIDDDPNRQGRTLNGLPTFSLDEAWDRMPEASVVCGVGSPRTRQRLAEKAQAIGFRFATVVHPRTERSKWIELGDGTVVCAGNILTTNIKIGLHVQINLDCTIGHDAVLGDYTTLAPGVHISGWVHMGQRVYLGTGAVVLNGTEEAPIVLGDDAVVGAGACVTKSIGAGLTVVGVPAKPLSRGGSPA
jgi:sugar O-acyltransferase (sialic acid O-acetyltransferase NeuD family)